MKTTDELITSLKDTIEYLKEKRSDTLNDKDRDKLEFVIDELYGYVIRLYGIKNTENAKADEKAKIVTLCGSTKFKDEYINIAREESLKGNIVISVGLYGHHEEKPLDPDTKKMLDRNHLQKIDMSDEILVINKDGYIGDSTQNEIDYAINKNKLVRYVYPLGCEIYTTPILNDSLVKRSPFNNYDLEHNSPFSAERAANQIQ